MMTEARKDYHPMITYQQVQKAMLNPPPEDLIDLFNELNNRISRHDHFIDDDNPFNKLKKSGTFCMSATSIQSDYIAFVLGKHTDSQFPSEVLQLFFNIDPDYRMQFSPIEGKEINGCICVIHFRDEEFNLKEVYEHIYT